MVPYDPWKTHPHSSSHLPPSMQLPVALLPGTRDAGTDSEEEEELFLVPDAFRQPLTALQAGGLTQLLVAEDEHNPSSSSSSTAAGADTGLGPAPPTTDSGSKAAIEELMRAVGSQHSAAEGGTSGLQTPAAEAPTSAYLSSASSVSQLMQPLERTSSCSSTNSSSSLFSADTPSAAAAPPAAAAADEEAGPIAPMTRLDLGCLLADDDLDSLLQRLERGVSKPGSTPSVVAHSPTRSQAAPWQRHMPQNSSALSSDNSSNSVGSDAQDTSGESPQAAHLTGCYSSYEPRWKQQQQELQELQQARPGSKASSSSAVVPPGRKQQCGGRVWVPEQQAVVLDLRCVPGGDSPGHVSSSDGGSNDTATHTSNKDPAAAAAVVTTATASTSTVPAGSDCDSSGSGASSDEEWHQFRQQQHQRRQPVLA